MLASGGTICIYAIQCLAYARSPAHVPMPKRMRDTLNVRRVYFSQHSREEPSRGRAPPSQRPTVLSRGRRWRVAPDYLPAAAVQSHPLQLRRARPPLPGDCPLRARPGSRHPACRGIRGGGRGSPAPRSAAARLGRRGAHRDGGSHAPSRPECRRHHPRRSRPPRRGRRLLSGSRAAK
eukprot:scaffold21737_cov114-Isochrysis_galbana.AAC.4